MDVQIVGDASETALLRFADSFKPIESIRERLPMLFEVPFNSTNKFHVMIVEDISPKATYARRLLIKGAPEVVLKFCKTWTKETNPVEIDESFTKEFQLAYERFGGQGERVLGFAEIPLESNEKQDVAYNEDVVMEILNHKNLTFIGLVSMMDPPREGVADAVIKCKTAGIKVVMITGDHPITAAAIAKKIGIFGNSKTRKDLAQDLNIAETKVAINDPEITGAIVAGKDQFEALNNEDWERLTNYKEVIFSRMTPQFKLEIVSRFQQAGAVVAVTGDGVNDSPALKQADIGVAMGLAGSDVAKEAADVILMDDNFASIVISIEQGRTIFDNLKKTIAYTLTHLWPEVVPVLIWLAFDFPLGLTSVLILSIDCGTELGPAISLAYEKQEEDIMEHPPRDSKKDRLVSARLLCYSYLIMGNAQGCFGVLSYFLLFYYKYALTPSMLLGQSSNFVLGASPISSNDGRVYDDVDQVNILNEVNSAFYISIVFSQFWHIWMCKSRRVSIFHRFNANAVMIYGVMLEIAIMTIIVYVPFMQVGFGSANVDAVYWCPPLLFAFFCWTYNETRKRVSKSYPNGFVANYLMW